MTRQEIVDTMKYCLEHGSMGGRDCWVHVDDNGHISDDNARDHCPNKNCKTGCVVTTLREAATLLEDPPIEPVENIVGDALYWRCGKCGFDLRTDYKYCPKCGRPVKWE